MHKYYLIIIFLSILSCNSSTQDNTDEKSKAVKDLTDFSKVDSYPQFANCDEFLDKEKEINCFSNQLNSFLDKTLRANKAYLKKIETNKIKLYISIDRIGQLHVDSLMQGNQMISTNNKLIKSINEKSNNLTIQPALKQGTPVKVHFEMPVNIEYVD